MRSAHDTQGVALTEEPSSNMSTIRSRAPLRLGLAGGGTDVSPYCDEFGGLVLNATIDRYAYAVLRDLDRPSLVLRATDQQQEVELPVDRPPPIEGSLRLHRAVCRAMMSLYRQGECPPLELVTYCDAPVGSGLGASSTLVVAMVRAFVELWNLPLDEYEIAQLSFHIERVDCGLEGGRQDQYSAAFGGVNYIEFSAGERVIVNPLRIKPWVISELEASTVLFYTGVSRESARIIADQRSGVAGGSTRSIEAMHDLKREAQVMKECLLRGDFEGLIKSMQQGWMAKKNSSSSVSSPLIESIYDAAIAAGARAGKVSGAGGGGFMLFFVPPERRMDVIRVLQGFDGVVSNCHFTKHGAQAWSL
jgi:D-glycero-alpha-D-manno-heptose-7-phosphate kinase